MPVVPRIRPVPLRLVFFLYCCGIPFTAAARGQVESLSHHVAVEAPSRPAATPTSADQAYELLRDREFTLERSEGRLLSAGQSLEVPRGTRVTVDLDADVRFDQEGAEPLSGEALRLSIQMVAAYRRMSLPEIRIPVLRDGQSLRLSFSFQAGVPLGQVRAYLYAQSVNGLHPVRLHVEWFTVRTVAAAGDLTFRLHYLQIGEGRPTEVAGGGDRPPELSKAGPAPAGSIAYRSNRETPSGGPRF